MRRVSKKLQVALRVYARERVAFLTANPWCIRCGGKASEVHHARGRVAGDLLRQEDWRAACHPCHLYITDHPAEAIQRGWSLPRIGRAESSGGDAA